MKLPPVTLSKVTREHAVALQVLVLEYMVRQQKDLQHQLSVRYHSALQELSVCIELYLTLRTKIESGKLKFTFSIKAYQAATLLFACSKEYKPDGSFKSHVALIYQNDLDNQLKNMIKALPNIEEEEPEHKNLIS